MEQNQLLDDFEQEWVYASHGKRLVNFLFDLFGYYIVIYFFAILYFWSNRAAVIEEVGEPNGSLEFIFLILYFFSYFFYYSIIELITGGRSLGKLITGTKAVNLDGSKMSVGTIFKRNIIRMVPFELFSYFGTPCYPWHDSWSDTMVIDIKKSNAIKL